MGLWDALEDLAEKGIDAAAEWIDEEVGAEGVISDFVAEHREEIVDGAAAIATSDDPLATAEDKLDGAYDVVEAEVVDEVTEQAADYVGEDIVNLAGNVASSDDPLAKIEELVDNVDAGDVIGGAEKIAGLYQRDENGDVTFTEDPNMPSAEEMVGISLEDILSPEEIENSWLDEDELIDLIDHGIAGRLYEPQEYDPNGQVEWVNPGEDYIPEPEPTGEDSGFTVQGGEEYNPEPEPEPVIDTAVEPAPSDFETAITQAESVDASVGAMFEEL